jgi:hypothetical protein
MTASRVDFLADLLRQPLAAGVVVAPQRSNGNRSPTERLDARRDGRTPPPGYVRGAPIRRAVVAAKIALDVGSEYRPRCLAAMMAAR